jgi:hypothetical protein
MLSLMITEKLKKKKMMNRREFAILVYHNKKSTEVKEPREKEKISKKRIMKFFISFELLFLLSRLFTSGGLIYSLLRILLLRWYLLLLIHLLLIPLLLQHLLLLIV